MAETTAPLEVVEVDYVCDACGTGRMRPAGTMLLTDPPKWPHQCSHCGDEKVFGTKYPTVGYRRKD